MYINEFKSAGLDKLYYPEIPIADPCHNVFAYLHIYLYVCVFTCGYQFSSLNHSGKKNNDTPQDFYILIPRTCVLLHGKQKLKL